MHTSGIAFFSLLMLTLANGVSAQPLRTAQVQAREIDQRYSIDGVVEAARQSTVSAQISGRVKSIYFDVGDRVSAGQIIVRIDEREANQMAAGSNAQLAQAQAALDNARLNYARAQQLFAQKFISQAALDKARSDFEMAQAQAQASAAGAQQSALAQSYTAVVAPYGGVVAARHVELGEMVTVGKPLMTGFDPSQLRVIANVPQDRLQDIGAHPEVTVEVPSLNRWIKAASVTVQPSADLRTHSTPVRIGLPANQPNLYPGMFVRTHFVVGKENKLLIPASAVVRRHEVVAVYVVDEQGMPRLRQVRLGAGTEDGEIEVLAGLQDGERIALDAVQAGMVIKK
ncbi:efflux RND transporter periplasmic adaptor subunit [Ferrigenium sp. UT5]|uniref:efflux RND transporter periplasmic adaptor subunit n=1 Tax=Ferrigenium sp. UT5 TaxID=3242105 RepID=UPI003550F32D